MKNGLGFGGALTWAGKIALMLTAAAGALVLVIAAVYGIVAAKEDLGNDTACGRWDDVRRHLPDGWEQGGVVPDGIMERALDLMDSCLHETLGTDVIGLRRDMNEMAKKGQE